MTLRDLARFGWASDLEQFAKASVNEVADSLEQFIRDASPEQIKAWRDSIPWLQDETRIVVELNRTAERYSTILEYELPLERRRPDVIVLENGVVVVLELKSKAQPSQADIDQVAAYARDLRAYHRECHERPVYPVLVPARAKGEPREQDGVRIVGPHGLAQTLMELSARSNVAALTKEAFLRADAYSPLPTLVRAARELFENGELRSIKRAEANTGPALQAISDIAHEAARTKSRRLVLLSGVPGSGKTLVGLQLVHSQFLDDLAPTVNGSKATSPAIFLSGNMALVAVLTDAMKEPGGGGKTFVRDVKGYVSAYANSGAKPPHNLLVFDEAQRAWDAARLASKNQGNSNHHGLSEPELFIEFAERVPEWCVVVALIGTGQEIHVGEEGGVAQWCSAVDRSRVHDQWTVHAPPLLAPIFERSKSKLSVERALNLDVQLRFHTVSDLHSLVAELLGSGDAAACRLLAEKTNVDGGRLFVTRDLDLAKSYVVDRYRGFRGSRYGIVGSSRDKVITSLGIKVPPVSMFNVAAWFNREPGDKDSCCTFKIAANEFACQGLELDFAVVCWGKDFRRVGGQWSIESSTKYRKSSGVKDPLMLRANAYRVLLTRGRDGLIAFLPPMPELDETYRFLLEAGFRELPREV